jgi:hypothetical protein
VTITVYLVQRARALRTAGTFLGRKERGAHPTQAKKRSIRLMPRQQGRLIRMDDTGMAYADKVGMITDVLLTWGGEAAQELADQYAIDLKALTDESKLSDLPW